MSDRGSNKPKFVYVTYIRTTPQKLWAALTQPAPAPYRPPPITTFSDRVNSAIQAYPLEKGIGNNPIDQQQFIRQRLNQP